MSHPYVTVEVRGDHRAVGRAVGEAAREHIAAAVDFYSGALPTLAGLSFAEAELAVRPYIERARQVPPQIVAELEGTAEGSGTTLWEIAVLTCGEELTCVGDPAQHCTTLAICGDGQAVVGHDEGWYAGDVDANVLLRATLLDGTTFVSMTAAGSVRPKPAVQESGSNTGAIVGGVAVIGAIVGLLIWRRKPRTEEE